MFDKLEVSNRTFVILLAMKTKGFRHALVKLIAPTVYRDYLIREKDRPMMKFLDKNYDDNDLVGAEIGTYLGENAENILKTISIKKLYLIDSYIPYVRVDGVLYDTKLCFPIAKQRLSRFKQKIRFIKKKSSEAVNDVPDNLDFVYIDGNHIYEHVKEDIELYYPKIKRGGVIGGHDFNSTFLGVCKAVIEFSEKNNLELQGKNPDWWIVKK